MSYSLSRLSNDQIASGHEVASSAAASVSARPTVGGKFVSLRGNKFYIRGVTYGTFKPDDNDREYPNDAQLEADFRAMVENGFNTVRLYTCPGRDILDIAERVGLKVMVSLLAEAYVGYLNDPGGAFDFRAAIAEK